MTLRSPLPRRAPWLYGIDVWRCELCDRKVRKDRPHFTAMDGMRAHNACVEAYRKRERAADRREYREYLRAAKLQ